MLKALFFFFAVLLPGVSAANSGVSASDMNEIRGVIHRQIDAFRRDDAPGAFALVSPGVQQTFGTPERFFRRHFVANLCPLLFLEASGRNRTPDALRGSERAKLLDACRRHLRRLVALLEPEWVVGIGAFAADQAREALRGSPVRIARILHPSPANPRAGAQWGLRASLELADQGVCPR